MKVFIIHGSFGDPEENWSPWLKAELEQAGHTVVTPQFPVENYADIAAQLKVHPGLKSKIQDLQVWLKAFSPYRDQVTSDTVFVAHSIAPAFVLHLLPTLPVQVRGCIFVAPFLKQVGIPEYDAVNYSFVTTPVDWKAVGEHCPRFEVIGSDDDPYVPAVYTEDVLDHLSKVAVADLSLVAGGKHFNTSAGFTEFPLVRDLITAMG